MLDGTHTVLKLRGFSHAKSVEDSSCNTAFGNLGHVPPEAQHVVQPGDTYDGRKADSWGMGVLLYAMVFFRSPFAVSAHWPGSQSEHWKAVSTGWKFAIRAYQSYIARAS